MTKFKWILFLNSTAVNKNGFTHKKYRLLLFWKGLNLLSHLKYFIVTHFSTVFYNKNAMFEKV